MPFNLRIALLVAAVFPAGSNALLYGNQYSKQGCYASLSGWQSMGSQQQQTGGTCGGQCSDAGMPLFALSGTACYCGSAYPPESDQSSSGSCNTPCSYFQSDTCGESGVFIVYSIAGKEASTAAASSAAPTSSSQESSQTATSAASSTSAEAQTTSSPTSASSPSATPSSSSTGAGSTSSLPQSTSAASTSASPTSSDVTSQGTTSSAATVTVTASSTSASASSISSTDTSDATSSTRSSASASDTGSTSSTPSSTDSATGSRASSTANIDPNSKSKSGGSGISGGAIAGIVVGVVAGVVIVAGLIILMCLRWRRRDREDDYYSPSSSPDDLKSNIGTFSQTYPPQRPVVDQRLNPAMLGDPRISIASLADARDYSRQILKVANPDEKSII